MPSKSLASFSQTSPSPHNITSPEAKPIVMCWSGGKDSCLALQALLADPAWDVRGLLTSCNQVYGRISIHGVREELLNAQAEALRLPLKVVYLPAPCTNAEYEKQMGVAVEEMVAAGIQALGFGDLFLADIRAYRERMLAPTPLQPVFPLWGKPTKPLAEHAAATLGITLVCISHQRTGAPKAWAGKEYNAQFVQEIPEKFDPCGENGEFHSFVHHAPCFAQPIPIQLGEVIEREGCTYADLLPA